MPEADPNHPPGADPTRPPGIVPDDLPKKGLFAEPILVADLSSRGEALDDGKVRVTFRAVVKDAEGRRCPELAVEAWIHGPRRSGTGTAWTNLLGAVEFRMTGPPGTYRCQLLHVAAGGLDLDPASPLDAEHHVEPT